MSEFLELHDENEGVIYINQDSISLIYQMIEEIDGKEFRRLGVVTEAKTYVSATRDEVNWLSLSEMQREQNKFLIGGD